MHLHVLNIIRKRAGYMLLGGGSMCEAGGCGLQREEGGAPRRLPLPTGVLLLCLRSLQRPRPLQGCEAERLGGLLVCPEPCDLLMIMQELGGTVHIRLRKGLCVRINTLCCQIIYKLSTGPSAGGGIKRS